MKALILAAGFGTRMRPLTEHCPKPLLEAGGTTLIEHTIKALRTAGVTELVINHAWLGQKIEAHLGDGRRLGVTIQFSAEGEPLGTAGGIKKALPLLTDNREWHSPFIVVNGDIWTDYIFNHLTRLTLPQNTLAHLVMVDNPDHNPQGDFVAVESQANKGNDKCKTSFGLLLQAKAQETDSRTLTYSGIGLYRPELFKDVPTGIQPLAPVLHKAMQHNRINGEKFAGQWSDIGTPTKLAWLDQHLNNCAR